MGLAPDIIKVDDMICILFGCSVPVILRRASSNYTLVGVSYADGFMQGEATKEFERGTYSSREFHLI